MQITRSIMTTCSSVVSITRQTATPFGRAPFSACTLHRPKNVFSAQEIKTCVHRRFVGFRRKHSSMDHLKARDMNPPEPGTRRQHTEVRLSILHPSVPCGPRAPRCGPAASLWLTERLHYCSGALQEHGRITQTKAEGLQEGQRMRQEEGRRGSASHRTGSGGGGGGGGGGRWTLVSRSVALAHCCCCL